MSQQTANPRITLTGALALIGARIANLPPGEWTIHLDLRHPSRPRWKVQPAPEWEHERSAEQATPAGRKHSHAGPENSRGSDTPQR